MGRGSYDIQFAICFARAVSFTKERRFSFSFSDSNERGGVMIPEHFDMTNLGLFTYANKIPANDDSWRVSV